MSVSEDIFQPLGGEYATSRRGGIDYTEFEKIRALCAAGVSVQTIAVVLGRPVCDVQPVAACFPKGLREGYTPPAPYVEPRPPVTFSHGVAAPPSPYLRVAMAVAEKHGVTVAHLRGETRARTVVVARWEAFWVLRTTTALSLPQIGKWFGKDHTTVLHGLRGYQKRLEAAALRIAAE